jgi:hypothetical protein
VVRERVGRLVSSEGMVFCPGLRVSLTLFSKTYTYEVRRHTMPDSSDMADGTYLLCHQVKDVCEAVRGEASVEGQLDERLSELSLQDEPPHLPPLYIAATDCTVLSGTSAGDDLSGRGKLQISSSLS